MSTTKLYCGWFCPFAQRVWVALEYKGVDYTYVEQDPYDKSPEWLAISPNGMVPCLNNEGKTIFESSILVEYINDYWTNSPDLLPKDPYARAMTRIWSDHISKKIVPNFYALLKKSDEERVKIKQDILSALLAFQEAISDTGPYFMGAEFGMVDVMLGPFVQRMVKGSATDLYGGGFHIPETAEFAKLQRWWENVQEVAAYKRTIHPVERINEFYQTYAEKTA